jgi:hypothetical protein
MPNFMFTLAGLHVYLSVGRAVATYIALSRLAMQLV